MNFSQEALAWVDCVRETHLSGGHRGLTREKMQQIKALPSLSCPLEYDMIGSLIVNFNDISLGQREPMTFRYTNWRGETAARRVIPFFYSYKATGYHPGPQWVLTAFCLDRGDLRDFAHKDMALTASPQQPPDNLLAEVTAVLAEKGSRAPELQGFLERAKADPELYHLVRVAIDLRRAVEES